MRNRISLLALLATEMVALILFGRLRSKGLTPIVNEVGQSQTQDLLVGEGA